MQGGIAVEPFLGSASTHILSGLGGFEGRPLRKGDVLRIGSASKTKPFHKRTIAPQASQPLFDREILRVTPGPQADWFPESSLRSFYAGTYRVGEQSNRMGLRLKGASDAQQRHGPDDHRRRLARCHSGAAGGAPIILFVEQQTTGGYPKIANVISADLHRVGQLRPRDEIRFEQVTFDQARSLLIEQEKLLASGELILE